MSIETAPMPIRMPTPEEVGLLDARIAELEAMLLLSANPAMIVSVAVLGSTEARAAELLGEGYELTGEQTSAILDAPLLEVMPTRGRRTRNRIADLETIRDATPEAIARAARKRRTSRTGSRLLSIGQIHNPLIPPRRDGLARTCADAAALEAEILAATNPIDTVVTIASTSSFEGALAVLCRKHGLSRPQASVILGLPVRRLLPESAARARSALNSATRA